MKKWLRVMVLAMFAALALFPVCFLVGAAFMGNREIIDCIAPVLGEGEGYAKWHLLPWYPTLENLVELLLDSPEYFRMFWNSVRITVCILAGQLLFGMPAAWGLAQYRFRGRKAVYFLFILMMMMPFQVMMLSEYLVLDKIGLLDSYGAVVWPGIFSTFSVFLMYRFFSGIPGSIIEAARIDGAGEWRIFWRIGVPLGRAGIFSAVTLSFLECWNMIEQPLTFFKTKSLWPLSLFFPEIDSQNSGLSFCASLIAVIPAVLVFLCGQDYLEQGIGEMNRPKRVH